MWATFPTKAQKQLYMKFVCTFSLDFPIPASQANPYQYFTNLFGLLDSVNPRKTCSKRHGRLFLWSKLPTYFDDVTTIENNRKVRVNIDVTLVAIFRILENIWFKTYFDQLGNTFFCFFKKFLSYTMICDYIIVVNCHTYLVCNGIIIHFTKMYVKLAIFPQFLDIIFTELCLMVGLNILFKNNRK